MMDMVESSGSIPQLKKNEVAYFLNDSEKKILRLFNDNIDSFIFPDTNMDRYSLMVKVLEKSDILKDIPDSEKKMYKDFMINKVLNYFDAIVKATLKSGNITKQVLPRMILQHKRETLPKKITEEQIEAFLENFSG
jgi:hypothetical protein